MSLSNEQLVADPKVLSSADFASIAAKHASEVHDALSFRKRRFASRRACGPVISSRFQLPPITSELTPTIGALPDELRFSLAGEPRLSSLCELMVAEAEVARCGGDTIEARLCEIIVVLAIRKAIAIGTVDAGLLAGLAHPRLHASLVAMHDDPARNWKVANLADVADMSRGQFISTFTQTVGQSPIAYLNSWRLALRRAELRAGRGVKSVAAKVGFGSAAAFSRAYSRKFGSPPIKSKAQQ